jgi:hypothetical protein
MGLRDAAEALAEGQRAARSATPEWRRATPQKLWPKANAQRGVGDGTTELFQRASEAVAQLELGLGMPDQRNR